MVWIIGSVLWSVLLLWSLNIKFFSHCSHENIFVTLIMMAWRSVPSFLRVYLQPLLQRVLIIIPQQSSGCLSCGGSSPQVLSFTHPVSFHSAETFESLLGCLKMDDEKVAEAALQIFKNTGSKLEESFPHIKSYVSIASLVFTAGCVQSHSSIQAHRDIPDGNTGPQHTALCKLTLVSLLGFKCGLLSCSPKCFTAGTAGQSQERPSSPGEVCHPLHQRHVHQQRHTLRPNLWGQSVSSFCLYTF